jgi:membrane protein YdbS with pleckstrin-like domain
MVRVVNLEGAREMIQPSITPEQQKQLINVLLGYSIWILASVIAYYFILPDNWKWLAYGPVVFIFLAFIITGIVIISRPIMPKPI